MRHFAALLLVLAGCLDPTPEPVEVQWTITNPSDEAVTYQVVLEGRVAAEASGELEPGEHADHTLQAMGDEVSARVQGAGDLETVVLRNECRQQVLESTWNGTWSLSVVSVADCAV